MLHTLVHASGFSLTLHPDLTLELKHQGRSLLGRFGLHWALLPPSGESWALGPGNQTLERATVDEAASTVLLEFAPYQGVRTSAHFSLSDRGLHLQPAIHLDLSGAPDFVQVEAFFLNSPQLSGSFLEGLGEAAGWRFFPLAYNSFSPAFVRDSRSIQSMPRFYTAGTFNQNTHSHYWGNWSDLHTAWMASIHHASSPETLLLGWLTAKKGLGEVAIRRRQPSQLEARLTFARRHMLPGEKLVGDVLEVAFSSDGEGLLESWTLETAHQMQARKPLIPVPTGWCSWYYYYTAISEKEMLQNLEQLAGDRERMPVTCVQLDDGYQTAVGDWLSVNEKFPSGLEALARAIREKGFVAGIWTAPFMIQRGSEVFKKHKDWLIRTHDGKLEDFGYHPIWGVTSGQVYCLDPTHPGVQAHLTHVYSTLKKMGYDYFKIDFLNAGLQPGRRYDRRKSPVESFRLGLEIIRAAVGDSFVLGCGAPLVPCIGMVDAMRISSDVKEAWDDRVLGFISNGNGHPAAELAILNSMTRSHLHDVWWYNDPDCLLVRDQRSTLKEVEVRTLLTVLSLTGGMLLLSDDLTQLRPERRLLAELALPVKGTAARALGVLEEPRPRRYVRARTLADGTKELLGAWINWGEEIEERGISPQDFGLTPGLWHCYELWSDHWRILEGDARFPLTLDPHECGLMLFREVRPYPQLITVALHIGQTTVLVPHEHWDEARGCLTLELETGALRQGRVWLSEPKGYKLREIQAEGGAKVQGSSSQPGATRHRVSVDKAGRLLCWFERVGG